MYGSIVDLICGWMSLARIVKGGRGGRVEPVVIPETTDGVGPPDAWIDCTGATDRPLTLAGAPPVLP